MIDDDDLLGPNLEASLDELKDIYRILAENRDANPELATNGFFQSLRGMLEAQATVEGVDIKSASEWAAWLHDTGSHDPIEPPRDVLN